MTVDERDRSTRSQLDAQVQYTSIRSTVCGHPTKKVRTNAQDRPVPVTYGLLQSTLGKEKRETIKVLFDSGTSSTIASKRIASHLRIKKDSSTQWTTAAGTLTTTSYCKMSL